MKQERINEIWAVVLFALTVIVFISLFSFDPADAPFYTSGMDRPVGNFAGIVGAYLAGVFVFLLGKASFVIPMLTLVWAIGRLTGNVPEKSYSKIAGAFVLIASFGSLLSMINRYDSVVRFSAGGIVGLGFSNLLVKYFGNAGAYIIIISLITLSLLLATEFLLFPFIKMLYKKLKALFSGMKRSVEKKPVLKLKPKIQISKAALKPPARERIIKKPEAPRKPLISIAKKIESKRAEVKKASGQPEPVAAKAKEDTKATEKRQYVLPPLDMLDSPPSTGKKVIEDDFDTNTRILEETLSDFGLEVKVVKIEKGPAITRYELEPAPGIKISRISALSDNIALAMKAQSVRIVAPIPGKGTVGVEVPNSETSMVYLKEIIESREFTEAAEESKLAIALGKSISGHPVIADLSDMPHLLIAGATGSGKTVCVNSLIASLLFSTTPDDLRFLMVDPKMVELSIYNDIPHLLCPVVTEPKKVSAALNWIVSEMEKRYKLFAKTASRNIDIYNEKLSNAGADKMPYIIVIIDELADLMVVAQQDIENAITRLAQLSRAVGIHIILATQRPSVDVITGVIKANFPSRISFKVASKVDSRTVLDANGADKLLGKGDMLFVEPGASRPIRAQGSLVSDPEIEKIVNFIKDQGEPEYNEDILKGQKKAKFKTFEKDEVYDEAVKLVVQTKQASVSMLQRRLGLGYTRAARLIDMMEDEGIVGPYAGSKPREILIGDYKKEEVETEQEG